MRCHYLLLLLFLCAVAVPAAALNPVNAAVSTSKDWIIADGTDSSVITITLTDGTNKPIGGADLVLSLDKNTWSLRDTVLKTDATGTAQTLFLPTTKSGTATITVSATVAGVTTTPVTASLVQKIDAGTPYTVSSSYPSAATVGTVQNITVGVFDAYGNPVTSKRLANAVVFTTTSSGSNGFSDGTGNLVKTIPVPLNDTGYARVPFTLNTKVGDNFVMIAPPAPLMQSLIAITGVGNGLPYSIIQSVSPPGNPPYVMTDGSSQAAIIYFLYDQWGNPSTDQDILITTSAGESKTFTTNQDGQVTMFYGPKQTAGFYSITATAVANTSVKITQTLQFVSGDPKDMILTASPQTMASLDVNPAMVGSVIAKVIDEKGNPVKGETVNFRIQSSGSDPFPRTQDPQIESGGVQTTTIGAPIPVITDPNGQAVLDFYPGAFPKYGETGWNENAQGTATINATWIAKDGTSVIRTITLSYKNYPFLSVYTDVIPKTVQVGGAVDVSVRLKGDGWALQPKPIDVMLCTDRSATMLYNESVTKTNTLVVESPNDRMVDAMNAAINFVGQTTGQDRVGLVTFGSPTGGIALLYNTGNAVYDATYKEKDSWRAGHDYKCDAGGYCKANNATYQDNTDDVIYVNSHYSGHGLTGKDYRTPSGLLTEATLDSTINTYDKTQVINAIKGIVPAGGTPTRPAIYMAAKEIVNHPRDGAVQAIILLTDGSWNLGGDPMSINTHSIFGQESYDDPGGPGTGSVIAWAAAHNIKIFTIALVNGTDVTDAPNLADLQAYADQTGGKAYVATSGLDLKGIYTDIAGALREEASIDTHVALDFQNVEVNSPGSDLGSNVFQYEFLGPDRSTYIVSPTADPVLRDDSANWAKNQNFSFDPGTIKVNQEWRVNFTLQTLEAGNIKVLSSKTSKVTFKGTVGSVDIPDTFVTAIPAGIEKGPQGIDFQIKFADPARKNPDSDKKVAQLEWNVIYDPNGHDNFIAQQVWIAPVYSEAYQYKDTLDPMPRAQGTEDYNLDISGLKPGVYKVKVIGHVSDANDASDVATIDIPADVPNAQIRIQ